MLVAMGIAAFFCIALGIYPKLLWSILPYSVDCHAYTAPHVVGQLQLLFFAALAWLVLKKFKLYPQEKPGQGADVDVVYRKLAPAAWSATLWVGRPIWSSLLGAGRWLIRGSVAVFYGWVGPKGMFGRSWTVGAVSRWIVFGLGFFLLFFFLWR